jgi:adenylate cyclase
MVDAALRFVEASEEDPASPALRVGMAFGPAVNRWGDWYGSPVNIASRLTTRARPTSVLATEAMRDAASEGYNWSFAGEKRLKGLAAPLRTYRARRAED